MTSRTIFAYPLIVLAAFLMGGAPAFAKDGPTVSIGADGNVLVRGAEVTSVGSGNITATTLWGGTGLTWSVDTNADTNYVGSKENAASRSDIEEGDEISFAGTIQGSLNVLANTVRLWSEKADTNRTTITGTVTSVSDDSFIVKTSSGTSVTINVTNDTDIKVDANGDTLADLETGAGIVVKGAYEDDVFVATDIMARAEGRHPWAGIMNFWHNLTGHGKK